MIIASDPRLQTWVIVASDSPDLGRAFGLNIPDPTPRCAIIITFYQSAGRAPTVQAQNSRLDVEKRYPKTPCPITWRTLAVWAGMMAHAVKTDSIPSVLVRTRLEASFA